MGDRETAGRLEAQALVGSELRQLPPEERNAADHQLNKHPIFDDVLAEVHGAYQRLVTALKPSLNGNFSTRTGSPTWGAIGLPWQIVQVNVIDHYLAHIVDVARRVGQQQSEQ